MLFRKIDTVLTLSEPFAAGKNRFTFKIGKNIVDYKNNLQLMIAADKYLDIMSASLVLGGVAASLFVRAFINKLGHMPW
ncbi:hypothetical protein L2675_08495 [Shewanella dokdonensis]|uniref:Uncharacterized protein n=1 Tax=Shewanella dokdonensis TaxID=712036 RepID=A0ABX8DCD7_9GAMM|nr:hypothetical protein [Shewanella dokdonensis]QVK22427.1 hypothetical protein KHX94_13760 [Shewanella dokdonensis]